MKKILAGVIASSMLISMTPKKVEASWGMVIKWTLAVVVIAAVGVAVANAIEDASSDNPKGVNPTVAMLGGAAAAGMGAAIPSEETTKEEVKKEEPVKEEVKKEPTKPVKKVLECERRETPLITRNDKGEITRVQNRRGEMIDFEKGETVNVKYIKSEQRIRVEN